MAELHVDYRFNDWSEIIGNKAIKSIIKEKVENNDYPKASLFHGPKGCGKTSFMRLISNKLGCSKRNLYEYDMADLTKKDDMDSILSTLRYSPIVSKGAKGIKCYLLDEVHSVSDKAMNRMLKQLEEVPKDVYFFLATTEPKKVIGTVKSRCTPFEVKPLTDEEIEVLLKWVLESEEKSIDDEVMDKIVRTVEGIPRDALKLLDLVINVKKVSTAIEVIETGIANPEVIDIIKILLECKKGMWPKVAKKLQGIKDDPERIRMAIFNYLTSIVIKNPGKTQWITALCLICGELKEPLFYNGKAGLTIQLFSACSLFEN